MTGPATRGHRRRRRHAAAPLALAAALLATSACTGDADGDRSAAAASPTAAPAAVDLGGGDAEGAVQSSVSEVTLGVVVSLGSPPGEGQAWWRAAQGAQVAAYRYDRGDVDVTLEVRDDQGSEDGAVSAVRELVDAGVTGIVLASTGSHLDDALGVAQRAGVPVVLPYAPVPASLTGDASTWSLAPDATTVGDAFVDALAARELEMPYIVDLGGGIPEGIESYASRRVAAQDDAQPLVRLIRASEREDGVDSVLLSGPARSQAQLLVALQGADVDLPVLLTPEALSPEFSATLTEASAPLSGDLTTVGVDDGDLGAMRAGDRGASLSAFFAALRSATEDEEVGTFFDDQPFIGVAEDVDTRSHDAVVVLVEAARRADSTDAADVLAAMAAGFRLGDDDGLAGPALDLSSPQVVPPEEVVPLQASADDPGLRPLDPDSPPRLHWFAAPTG